jgi:hypothetical protein
MKYQVRRGANSPEPFETIGEFGYEELKSLNLAGVVKDTDLFSVEGKTEWTRVGSLFPKARPTESREQAGDRSIETRGRDEARNLKMVGAPLVGIGFLLLLFSPWLGIVSVLVGMTLFCYGRFKE